MKKIMATAVATAFALPVYAADVTLVGSVEWSLTDTNGATASAVDSEFNINASTETANGLTASATLQGNTNDSDGNADGDTSVTLGGPFGKLTLGDMPSAADSFDDKNDYSLVVGTSLTAPDADARWTLPTIAEGLTVLVSYSADSETGGGDAGAHTGLGLNYSMGGFTVSAGQNDNDDGSKITYTGASAAFGGLTVSVESMADDDQDGSQTAKLDEKSIGFSYEMGDVTLFGSNQETETNDAVTADVTAFGVHYSLGGGVTAFAESSSDDKNASLDKTAVGVKVSF